MTLQRGLKFHQVPCLEVERHWIVDLPYVWKKTFSDSVTWLLVKSVFFCCSLLLLLSLYPLLLLLSLYPQSWRPSFSSSKCLQYLLHLRLQGVVLQGSIVDVGGVELVLPARSPVHPRLLVGEPVEAYVRGLNAQSCNVDGCEASSECNGSVQWNKGRMLLQTRPCESRGEIIHPAAATHDYFLFIEARNRHNTLWWRSLAIWRFDK